MRQRNASVRLILSILCFVIQVGAAFAGEAPRWFVDGRPTLASREAVRVLEAARDDGLNPDDYRVRTIARALDNAAHGNVPAASAQAAISNALTFSLVRLIQDMRNGRISPRVVQSSFDAPANPLDALGYLRDAVRHERLPQAIEALRPRAPMYTALMRALSHYRALENNAALRRPLPSLPKGQVSIGQEYGGVAELASKLVALGDLPGHSQTHLLYDQALSDGVSAFQERHGLAPDGILGRETLAQLNKPVTRRIRQIELTLERLRWTPLFPAKRSILVNLPEFALHAFEGTLDEPAISMNVVIGKAPGSRTPQFAGAVRQVEFNPYWNIPPAIAKNEILPAVLRDPAFFIRQGFEFVGTDGTISADVSERALENVMRGAWRMRQRPGPANPLGQIKFVIPNNANIYLHDTPSDQLFQRSRRDFSHGCIRVQGPLTLAKFVLNEQSDWDNDRILTALASGKSFAVHVDHPVPVTVAYATAIVKPNGKVYFYADIYGNDQLLDVALRAQEKSRQRQTALLPTVARQDLEAVQEGRE